MSQERSTGTPDLYGDADRGNIPEAILDLSHGSNKLFLMTGRRVSSTPTSDDSSMPNTSVTNTPELMWSRRTRSAELNEFDGDEDDFVLPRLSTRRIRSATTTRKMALVPQQMPSHQTSASIATKSMTKPRPRSASMTMQEEKPRLRQRGTTHRKTTSRFQHPKVCIKPVFGYGIAGK